MHISYIFKKRLIYKYYILIYKFFKQCFVNKITQNKVHMNHFHTNYTIITIHKGYWNFQLSEDIFNFKI